MRFPLAMREFLRRGQRLALVGASALDRVSAKELMRLPVEFHASPGPLCLYDVSGRMVPPDIALFREALLEITRKVDTGGRPSRTSQ